MTEEQQRSRVQKTDQSESSSAESKACKGFGAVTPINQPEDWRAVRCEFEELVAEEIAPKDSQ